MQEMEPKVRQYDAPAKEPESDVPLYRRPISSKKGAFWTFRNRLRLAWSMAAHSTPGDDRWKHRPASERSEAFLNEACRLWREVTNSRRSLNDQLTYAQRMELALHLAQREAPTSSLVPYERWGTEVRMYLERQQLVLGNLAAMARTARPEEEMPAAPW